MYFQIILGEEVWRESFMVIIPLQIFKGVSKKRNTSSVPFCECLQKCTNIELKLSHGIYTLYVPTKTFKCVTSFPHNVFENPQKKSQKRDV